jgi:hypothetical protein
MAERRCTVLCDLEAYLCPRTVLLKEPAERGSFASSSQVQVRGNPRCTVAGPAPLWVKELVEIEGSPPLHQVIDRTRQFVRQDGQGVALTMCFRPAGEQLLARRVMPQAQYGGFGEGPLEGGSADLRAGDPVACAGRFLGALDQAAVRDTVLHAREPLKVLDLVEQDQTQDVPDAEDGAQEGQGLREVFSSS